MNPIDWKNFPLPLIQVNPPDLRITNRLLKIAYQNGNFSNLGEIQKMASKVLSKHVHESLEGYLASSNTSALASCLIAAGVRGRHVVLSNFTFAATLDAVILAGAVPIVCDINPNDLVISSSLLAKLLQDNSLDIAAVVPTRVLGYVSDLTNLLSVCKKFHVPMIVDAAASFPAKANKWPTDSQIHYEVFSFHATKVFGIGEGGFVVGTSEKIRVLEKTSNFGIISGEKPKFEDGLNAKADEFTAARAMARYSKYADDVMKRRDFVRIYEEIFSQVEYIKFLESNDMTVFSYFPIIFDNENQLNSFRNRIGGFLTTRRYYFPTISEGYIGKAQIISEGNLEVSNSISKRILCLPVYVNATRKAKIELEKLIKESLVGIA